MSGSSGMGIRALDIGGAATIRHQPALLVPEHAPGNLRNCIRWLTNVPCRHIGKYHTGMNPTLGDKSDILKGTLDMLILKIVSPGAIHGYAIAQRIQQISQGVFQLQQGSLYPVLHRLEDRELLKAEWKATETGREAKFYSLTAKGRKHLEAEISNWERVSGAVFLILRTAD